jgi:Tfp pilus assembly protein PilV
MSLIETMVALVVIVVGLTALQRALSQGTVSGQQATARTQAVLLGRGQLEQLRLQGFTALATQHSPTEPAPFRDSQQQVMAETFRWHIAVAPRTDDLLEVQLRVVWPWPAQTYHVGLATLVSRH